MTARILLGSSLVAATATSALAHPGHGALDGSYGAIHLLTEHAVPNALPALVAAGAAILAWIRWGRRPAPQPVRHDEPRAGGRRTRRND